LQPGSHRQQIKEQLGVLEERLEELGSSACANERAAVAAPASLDFGTDLLFRDALEAVRDLSQLVHEQQLVKSVPANEFLLRLCGLLVQDAAAQGVEIAVSHFGEGRISLEMAEVVLGAIVTGFRASLKSLKALGRAQRAGQHLFATGSVYLEVRSTPGEVLFRLVDDGQGFSRPETRSDRRFHRLREQIALSGGWFSYRSFGKFGGLIEFKVPFAHNRLEAIVARQGGFELLIPSSCVADVVRQGDERPRLAAEEVFVLHETEGLAPGGAASPVLLKIGVADLQFWVGCEATGGPVRARRAGAESFVEEGLWLRSFGLFREGSLSRALPLLDGAALVNFHKALGGEA
jgi:hypothetical protein